MSLVRLGILGCGDFTRLQTPALQKSRSVAVTAVYDPNRAAAEAMAPRLEARVTETDDALIEADALPPRHRAHAPEHARR